MKRRLIVFITMFIIVALTACFAPTNNVADEGESGYSETYFGYARRTSILGQKETYANMSIAASLIKQNELLEEILEELKKTRGD